MSAEPPKIAVEPDCWRHQELADAVVEGGGVVAPPEEAVGLVWAEPAAPGELPPTIEGTRIRWVQLPYAGIEPFLDLLDPRFTWTCGKGVYAAPVAEHVVAMTLACFRNLVGYGGATTWTGPVGRNLLGAKVTILGGGGITEELLGLLEPWRCEVTVVRRTPDWVVGAHRVLPYAERHDAVAGADVVVLALALTPETEGVANAGLLAAMGPQAWLVNVARGGHVVTDDLVTALRSGTIAGAALDVTEPEPLPDGHPLWELPNCLITPHVGNTPEMGLPLLADRVRENVRRFAGGEPLIGLVDLELGY